MKLLKTLSKMSNQIQQNEMQLEAIYAYAMAVKFDLVNGNFDDLLLMWIEHSKKLHTELIENRTDRARAIREKVMIHSYLSVNMPEYKIVIN